MKTRVIFQNDRTELLVNGELKAYVNEDDVLYGIDREGYAVKIGTIEHRSQIEKEWKKWRKDTL